MNNTSYPIPVDLSLPIPGDIGVFKVLLILAFILHIVFVNLMLSGSLLAVYSELRGMMTKRSEWNQTAKALATQVSVFKSIAVVLGVGPLLVISTIYTRFFYTSTILIGNAWLLLIPLLIAAFLLLYLYKFTWDRWQNRKGLHLFIGALGALCLLFVPLIFFTNVVSMLYPALWQETHGFFSALVTYPTLFQRYLHFLFASLSVTGIYFLIWANRKRRSNSTLPYEFVSRFGRRVALIFTAGQLIAGPLLLISLDDRVRASMLSGFHLVLLLCAFLLGLSLLYVLGNVLKKPSRKAVLIAGMHVVLLLGVMGVMRHEVRDLYLEPYQTGQAQS
ncbi:hypothetical protein [Tumebacillus flagellatus]|uniref:Cytochrome c class I n=1 Tax=Tumebacillus flagellatus TaxID=1157490 RepID=A0A074LL34_9BACL|nr:hypothetical protein [Tumebacillus flagellatus]KEO82846.1 hypothetical protein EL26_13135 [Tumebacillus flagellatus]